MRVVVCAIAKNEQNYINEWVEHYIKLGVDKIYIYDNDNRDSPFIRNFIVRKDMVDIYNIRGISEPRLQHKIYTKFYHTHKFDWCIFCDIDEYLTGITDIKEFLKQPQFQDTQQIRIQWKLFGDSGLITRDISKPIQESFTKEVKSTLTNDLKSKNNLEKQGKSIVRGGIQEIVIKSPHFASILKRDWVAKSVLPSGKPCASGVVIKEDYSNETVFMNHYMTKSLQEFIDQKLGRTDAVFVDNLKLNYYWRINRKTKAKIEYLKSRGIYGEQ